MLQNNPTTDQIYVGCDEVGRGCLAGPVVAAVVIWNPELTNDHPEYGHIVSQIRDSKKISKKLRDELTEFIKSNSIDYSITFIDNVTIDSINILNATYKAMHESLDKLKVDFDHILVDGNRFPKYKNKQHTCVVKGDDTYICIAAASILAKTARDNFMTELDSMFPEYKWKNNMGYGTKAHIDAIRDNGITKYHRISFYPCSVQGA